MAEDPGIYEHQYCPAVHIDADFETLKNDLSLLVEEVWRGFALIHHHTHCLLFYEGCDEVKNFGNLNMVAKFVVLDVEMDCSAAY